MTLDDAILDEAKALRDRLIDLRHESERAQSDLNHAIRRLHAAGGSLREIADSLGLSHQRVHQIVDVDANGRPRLRLRRARAPRRAQPFERFTPEARDAFGRAQLEARALGHDYLGTEHLLLGVALTASGRSAAALSQIGATPDRVRTAVERVVGRGETRGDEPSEMRLRPRLKRVLERAAREAGEGDVGTDELLLALVADGEGVAARILEDLGCGGEAAMRAALGRS